MIPSQVRLQKLLEMEQANPLDAFLKFAIAQEFVAQENFEEAEKYYQLLLRKFPDYLPTYYHFGKLNEQQGKATQARILYEKGIVVAKQQTNAKTLAELQDALFFLD